MILNSNGSVKRALEIAGLAPLLDFVIDSSVVGISKPDPRIFALGLQAAGAAPAETVYVGDSYFVDVASPTKRTSPSESSPPAVPNVRSSEPDRRGMTTFA